MRRRRKVKYHVRDLSKLDSVKLMITAPSRVWLSSLVDPPIPQNGEKVDMISWYEERSCSAMATEAYWDAWMRGESSDEIVLSKIGARWLLLESGEL